VIFLIYSPHLRTNDLSNTIKMELPTLYCFDAKGAKRMWRCWVTGDTLHRQYGLVDGKQILSERIIKGRSVGKKNETSSEKQAIAEANKEWVKQIDKGYRPEDKDGELLLAKINAAKRVSGGHNINTGAAVAVREQKKIIRKLENTCIIDDQEEAVIPMKAQLWEIDKENLPQKKILKYFSKITRSEGRTLLSDTPFFGQAKLDGWRARIALTQKGEVIITSNSGKQYPWFVKLRKSAKVWLSSNTKDLLDGLDGELYALELYDLDGKFIPEAARFSTICSICGLARTEPHHLEEQIQFHVFDLIDKTGKLSQVQRFKHLDKLFATLPSDLEDRFKRVPTEILQSVTEVPTFHDKFAEMGYEGVILRTFNNPYRPGKRSTEMRKFKNFIDKEYEIVDCHADEGVDIEHFVWVLKTEDDKEFSAKPQGTREERRELFRTRERSIGRWLSIKFQEFSEDGIPRFPIAKEFRTGPSID